ncbi:uncharacterized protein TOT_010000468 [Theileria orientalis strain Shintoku]|uniref:Uncharacterized protein n=1 Tax=Theileria orientalis strain Shintoku TaxID=869250 RepID=J4C7G6_THEOR|nr:uncharacterized protein TOT_010000468 [Theileria orientalis strain Shintoku]BAM39003.1 uncharacterized protein TOT_010000468 [Theileria orientalis strain Shintoku]|eukprot:XP_009689304.1 uncharacterized protein TOT_010000468 [Theileria orientalis strain Shintoku]
MKRSSVFKGVLVYLLVSLRESVCFTSAKWPAPANKIPIDLDLSAKESTYNYMYSTSDNSNIYIALNNVVFKSIRYEDKLMWTADNHTEYSTQVIYSPDYFVTLVLLDGNLKHFKFVGDLFFEVGLNELPTALNVDLKYTSYEYEYAPISNGHMFQAKSYYRFSSVKAGENVLFTAKTPEECAYVVSVTGTNFMTLLQLNGEIKQFKLLKNGWVSYTPNAELPKLSEGLPSQDYRQENREKFMDGCKMYFSQTFKDCPNLAMENARLRSELQHLDDELSTLKQDYDQFRSRVASLDNSIERMAESIILV